MHLFGSDFHAFAIHAGVVVSQLMNWMHSLETLITSPATTSETLITAPAHAAETLICE